MVYALLGIWVVLSAGVAWLAHRGQRSGFYWLLTGLVLSPLLAFVLLMMAKPRLKSDHSVYTITHDMALTHAQCPHCAEYVLPELSSCPYCKGAIEPNPQLIEERLADKRAEEQALHTQRRLNKRLGVAIVLVTALLFAVLASIR